MTMKKVIYLIFISAILVITPSCSNWLDINQSPNVATSVDPSVLFGYSTMSWSGNRCGGDTYIPLIFAAQTTSSAGNGGWGSDDYYTLSPYSLGNTWKAYYAVCGTNLKAAIKIAETSTPAQPHVAAQCKIQFAAVMYEATMLYGDIPYSESWNDAISYPKFDSQQSILNSLLSLLDEAIVQASDPATGEITTSDLAYAGNMDKWIRFANSLKLRIAMVMVDADPSKAALIKTLIEANKMINSAAVNYQIPYLTTAGKENPKFKILKQYYGGKNTAFFANNTVLGIMKPMNDPRLSVYFTPGKNAAGAYIGLGTNEEGDPDLNAAVSMYIYRADAPDLIFSYQEQLFLVAEAYARGLGVTKDLVKSNNEFVAAVKAAMSYYGVADAAINTFVGTKLPNLTTSVDPVKDIHLQQWVDLMDRPLEAFTQWRRSGVDGSEVPALTLPEGARSGPLFRRYEYSPDEATANPNTPKDVKYYTKMWFDK